MHSKNHEWARWLTALACLFALTDCTRQEATGSAQLFGSLQQSVIAVNITRVEVTVTAPDMASRTETLTRTDGIWSGTLGNLPSGSNRTFSAEAFDTAGTLRFAGQASGVTITAGQTTVVALSLQAVDTPPPFDNAVPIIDSLVAAAGTVAPGGFLSLEATAHDADPGDTLSYAWSSTAGGFYAPASPSTTWWAPTESGPVMLTLTVADAHGAVATLSFTIQVQSAGGAAAVQITFNSTPVVSLITASPSRVDVGETTRVVATASDGDGDALGYQWTAACAGTWSGASSATAQFTPSSRSSQSTCGDCPLTVTVTDAHGGQTTGTLRICVGPPLAVHLPPRIVSTYQSSQTVPTSGPVTLRVAASDPQSSALTFTWAASAGALGTPSSEPVRSEVQWTPPACVPASTPLSITATVVNAAGLSTSTTFALTGGSACTPGLGGFRPTRALVEGDHRVVALLPSGRVLALHRTGASAELYDPATETWSLTANMDAGHIAHSATVLATGKVLVVRKDAAAAELYDPATGTWAPTGSPQKLRDYSTATRLLSGKVLVVGGIDADARGTAELYDPVTGTWTSAGTLVARRVLHSATLLPSGKVLVVGGAESTTAELYDPATDSWTPTSAPIFSHGLRHTATLLPSGQVFVTGGMTQVAELYDEATSSWAAAPPMAVERTWHAAALLPSGKVLVTGGSLGSLSYGTSMAELYDPASGTWTRTGSMVISRMEHTALVLPSGRVLTVGGSDARFAELYEPTLGAWAPTQSMGLARFLSPATVLPSGQVLVSGGITPASGWPPISSAELYDAATGSWAPTGNMIRERVLHTATLLPSGRVLVAGGSEDATAELYEPATGSWLSAGGMSEVRYGHTATLLPSGKVLVAGGNDLAAAELYDPATNSWTPTGSMSSTRTGHTATLLPSGRVLAVGGNPSEDPPTATAELYDPGTGTWTPASPPIAFPPSGSTATLLLSGKVLVTGRDGSAQEYDSAAGTWTAVGRMRLEFDLRAAVRLPSGKVLVTGGGVVSAAAEIYDPVTRTWSGSPGTMLSARRYHSQALLPSGRVLVAGGMTEGGEVLTTAELYGP
ncbi:Kelch repeat-containing protein [Hyalangium minutum]|uniref:High-affinity leucine-specific transport system, periplasmic binding protein LivK n=1 Tax=Hyalangium minutum TaxID=394096 RepID=A0A085WAY7_9BACT|nr:kelch repeat-containing protein [Hyalangium minutum]KFE64850.1 High-affinity leucine-specific transport system, periplasmic binding protein LivK [Hyalangium minutum]